MRNFVTSILPPSGTASITVDPPMAPDEAPVLICALGTGVIGVQPRGPAKLDLENTHTIAAPFVFFVTHRGRVEGAVHLLQAAKALKGSL